MSVRVRLTRVGSKKNAVWRVVVADQRSPRDGRVIELVGRYNPQTEPSEIVLNKERIQHWIDRGAQPTATVKRLIRIQERADAGEPIPAAATRGPKKKQPAASAPEPEAAAPEPEAAAPEPEAAAEAPAEATPEAEAAPAEAAPEADAAPADDPPADEAPAEKS